MNCVGIKKEIEEFAKSNLMAYSGEISEGNIEWSNKIYLLSIKTLSVLESIKDARDENWIISVFCYEFHHWLDEVHAVLNKYDIEDDWDKIEKLVGQENSQIEWKSSFFTSTEQKFVNEEIEKRNNSIILSRIIDVILGMINANGGIVLVGLVENPDAIIREDVKRNLLDKNGITFFDIHYEFEKRRKTLDSVKREIQDKLFSETYYSADKFNDLLTVEPIEIRDENKMATIYKILVKKSSKYIFNAKKEKDKFWITLTKRADGRTIKVDPREYLSHENRV